MINAKKTNNSGSEFTSVKHVIAQNFYYDDSESRNKQMISRINRDTEPIYPCWPKEGIYG